jgi:hypothetical protein
MECSRVYSIHEYRDEIDEETWEKIAARPCNRA